MHMSRIGLEGEGKVLGTIALVLGAMMAIGALCGAAGISVSKAQAGFVLRNQYITQSPFGFTGREQSTSNGERLARLGYPFACPCSSVGVSATHTLGVG